MKVGIIRCMQTEDFCPGTNDFKMVAEKKGAFEGVDEPIEIIGFINCRLSGQKIGTAGAGSGKTGRGYHRFCLLHHQGQSHWLSMSIRC